MGDADVKILETLRSMAGGRVAYPMHPFDIARLEDAADLIERLAAEVERLTPKPMTPHEACKVMNERRYFGSTAWAVRDGVRGPNVWMGDSSTSRSPEEAVWIVQGLERDAATIRRADA